MPRFCITFDQKSPFRNGWVEIIADDEITARLEAMYAFGGEKGWSGIYDEESFFGNRLSPADDLPLLSDSTFFKAGKLGETIILPVGYKHMYE